MTKQIIIDDLLVNYTDIKGAGESSRALLFLHGWRSNKEVWQGIIERLTDLQIERLAIDLPGFGASGTLKTAMSVGDYAAVVAGFIKKLELRDVVIIGHSFGGRVGIKLSAAHPELVNKLVLVDSAGFAAPASKKLAYARLAKIIKPIFKPRVMQAVRRKIYQKLGAEDYVAMPELQQTFVKVVGEDLSGDIQNIRQPTLLVWGRNDKDTPLRSGERMHAMVQNSSLVILEHAGHFSFIDQPEKFAGVLKKFVS